MTSSVLCCSQWCCRGSGCLLTTAVDHIVGRTLGPYNIHAFFQGEPRLAEARPEQASVPAAPLRECHPPRAGRRVPGRVPEGEVLPCRPQLGGDPVPPAGGGGGRRGEKRKQQTAVVFFRAMAGVVKLLLEEGKRPFETVFGLGACIVHYKAILDQ